MKTYSSPGINWNWYLTVELTGDEVEVYSNFRLHRREDDNHPHTVGCYEMIEGPNRVLEAVRLCEVGGSWKTYKVCNPKNVFDYTNRR